MAFVRSSLRCGCAPQAAMPPPPLPQITSPCTRCWRWACQSPTKPRSAPSVRSCSRTVQQQRAQAARHLSSRCHPLQVCACSAGLIAQLDVAQQCLRARARPPPPCLTRCLPCPSILPRSQAARSAHAHAAPRPVQSRQPARSVFCLPGVAGKGRARRRRAAAGGRAPSPRHAGAWPGAAAACALGPRCSCLRQQACGGSVPRGGGRGVHARGRHRGRATLRAPLHGAVPHGHVSAPVHPPSTCHLFARPSLPLATLWPSRMHTASRVLRTPGPPRMSTARQMAPVPLPVRQLPPAARAGVVGAPDGGPQHTLEVRGRST